MGRLAVERVHEPGTGEIAETAALEAAVFGEGGLNEWHLPVIARRGRLFTAKDESGRVVGVASVIRCWDPRRAFLIDLAVEPSRRREGIAESLLHRAVAELRKDGIAWLELTVAPDNAAAVAFYRKLGFAPTVDLPDEYGEGRHRRLFALELS